MISEDDVERAYLTILKREPESPDVIALHQQHHSDIFSLVDALINSDEFRSRPLMISTGPFTASFDAIATIEKFACKEPPRKDRFITDYVGSLTDSLFFSHLATEKAVIETLPIPGNFHADQAEWAASMRAVDLASDSFNAIELGAGWAPWLVSCSLAAKRMKSASVRCLAVEADEVHVEYCDRHFRNNGFADSEWRTIHAAVGPFSGTAAFPASSDPNADWGMQPVFLRDQEEADRVAATKDFTDYRGFRFDRMKVMPAIGVTEALSDFNHVDLLHIDIQGGEADAIEAAIEPMSAKVRYLVIGTHSREIEGRLISVLSQSGWKLEIEKPCQFDVGDRLTLRADGTQGWRNAALV
jgi:FkbM family methyltransferase